MLDIQVEGLFSLPNMPFFHDKIVMTMGLYVISSLELRQSVVRLNKYLKVPSKTMFRYVNDNFLNSAAQHSS